MSYAVILLSALRGSSYKLSLVWFFEYWKSYFFLVVQILGTQEELIFFLTCFHKFCFLCESSFFLDSLAFDYYIVSD